MTVEAKEILCSINPQNSKLTTMFWRYPKFLHQESLRHRTLYIHDCLYDPDFSFSVSSARAIPFSKLLQEVRDPNLRAKPEIWGCEQKGMSPGDELTGDALIQAQFWWDKAANMAADIAEKMARAEGVLNAQLWQIPHKSIINRIIEPYIHVNCLVTGTDRGWMNFFGLRLDKAADPTLQILAQKAYRVWQESKPQKLEPGQWHLPFIDNETEQQLTNYCLDLDIKSEPIKNTSMYIDACIKTSAARCARLSYLSFDTNKRSTIEEDLNLYQRLVGSNPIHASPLEHQATPDQRNVCGNWWYPGQAGNLGLGWRQYRKTLTNESVAPLPERYR